MELANSLVRFERWSGYRTGNNIVFKVELYGYCGGVAIKRVEWETDRKAALAYLLEQLDKLWRECNEFHTKAD